MKAQGDRNGKSAEVHTVNRNIHDGGAANVVASLFLDPKSEAFVKCSFEYSFQAWHALPPH
jgi:hypothetical protein